MQLVTELQWKAFSKLHKSNGQGKGVNSCVTFLVQLFLLVTGLNEHNTSGSPCPSSTSQILPRGHIAIWKLNLALWRRLAIRSYSRAHSSPARWEESQPGWMSGIFPLQTAWLVECAVNHQYFSSKSMRPSPSARVRFTGACLCSCVRIPVATSIKVPKPSGFCDASCQEKMISTSGTQTTQIL